ncbi:MAG: GNAT family N-acetyltransferase, partial [Spirochaetales bacterium]
MAHPGPGSRMSDTPASAIVVAPATGAAVGEVRHLFLEYAEWLNVDLGFQGFRDELESLPGIYGRPEGEILLASCGDRVAGCVALKSLDHIRPRACEMKRLWVRPEFQRMGIGELLVAAIVDAATETG